MQDSKGIFPFIALVFTSENAVFLMGEYRTVPAGGWRGGCGLGRWGGIEGKMVLSLFSVIEI